jgi:hypothetical protein
MGLRVFDFKCAAGHVSEHFVEPGTAAVQCPHCDQLALRQISAPRFELEGITGAFPGAADKWVRDRESKMKQEQKNQERHGSYD